MSHPRRPLRGDPGSRNRGGRGFHGVSANPSSQPPPPPPRHTRLRRHVDPRGHPFRVRVGIRRSRGPGETGPHAAARSLPTPGGADGARAPRRQSPDARPPPRSPRGARGAGRPPPSPSASETRVARSRRSRPCAPGCFPGGSVALQKQNKTLLRSLLHLTNPPELSSSWKRDTEDFLIPPLFESDRVRFESSISPGLNSADTIVRGRLEVRPPGTFFVHLSEGIRDIGGLGFGRSRLRHAFDLVRESGKNEFSLRGDEVSDIESFARRYGDVIKTMKRDKVELSLRAKRRKRIANRVSRKNIIGEIFDTERTFVRAMTLFRDAYIEEIPTQRGGVSPKLKREIKTYVSLICATNTPFLQKLEEIEAGFSGGIGGGIEGGGGGGSDFVDGEEDIVGSRSHYVNVVKPQKIASLFLEYRPRFRNAYVKYANFFTQTLREWNKLHDSKEIVRQFCQEKYSQLRKRGHRATTFRSLLIMPVQRVPRYKLLLEDLLKRSEADLPYVEVLKDSISEIGRTALHVNRKRKENEHNARMNELAQRFRGLRPILPKKWLIRFSTSVKINQPPTADAQGEIYLFNELILLLPSKRKLIRIITDDPDLRCNLLRTDDSSFALELQRKTYVVKCDTPVVALEFVKDIHEQLVHVSKTVASYNSHYTREVYFGWLKKEGGGRRSRRLRRRWHVITADLKLKYYDKEKDSGGKMKGSYSLVEAQFGESKGRRYEFGLYVKTRDRVFYMAADSDEDREAWLDVLETVAGCPRVNEE